MEQNIITRRLISIINTIVHESVFWVFFVLFRTRMHIAEQVGSFNAVTFIIYICFILVFLVIFIFWTKRKLFKHRESSGNIKVMV